MKVTGDYDDKKLVHGHFRKPVKDYFWTPLYKSGKWDGHIKFFNLTTGHLPFGLYSQLFSFLKSSNIRFSIDALLKTELAPGVKIDLMDIVRDIPEQFTQREYQLDATQKILSLKRGILEHATASGKTFTLFLIFNHLIKQNYKKFIFIVPTISLISQGVADLKSYGINESLIGKYYGEEKDDSKLITIGTWQSLKNNTELLNSVDIVVCDEVHSAKATEISKLLEKCVNSKYRIGLTGSMPDWDADRFSIIGSIGPILHKISSYSLIHEDKVLSDLKIKVFNINYPKEIRKGIKDWQSEKKYIQDYFPRKIVVKNIISKYCQNENTLILFDEIELGKKYKEYLESFFPEKIIYWVEGKVKTAEREEIRINTNNQDNTLVFATLGTFSTGINIPKLHNIIFLYIGKAPIRIKQSIGRGLRKHESKEHLKVFDIADELKYSKKHLLERLKIYSSESFPTELLEINT